MATIQNFKSFDTTTLANFKSWAQAIGAALSTLGWVQAPDTTPASQVVWANVVDVPGNNVATTSGWSFTGTWVSGNPYTGGNDVVVYDPGSGPVAYQSVYNNHGTIGNVLRQVAQSDSITSVDVHSGGNTVYHGTFAGGATNGYQNYFLTISGCTNGANNGSWFCTGSTGTTITLQNANGVAESGSSGTMVSSANTVLYFWSTLITGWNDPQFVGQSFAISGYTNSANNGTFVCIGSSSPNSQVFAVTNASGVNESHAGVITNLTDPSTSSAQNVPLWAPYYYEIWQTNDALNATSPIFLRLVYSTQNAVLNGTGSTSIPRVFLSVGTRVQLGYLGGNTLNGATTPIEKIIQPGSAAAGSSTFECDFAGDAGGFQMHMWRDRPNATWTLIIDRAKNSGGVDTDLYFSVLSAQNNTRFQQQLFKQGAGTRCPNQIDQYWESIHSNATSFAQNGLVPAFPVFPIIGFVGNPLIRAVTIGTTDSTSDGEQFSISLYGTAHTYMVSQNSTVSEPGNLNPAILWE